MLIHVCPSCQSQNQVNNHDQIWVDVDSCECCGTSTTVHVDYTCPSCQHVIDEVI